jgi:hypothetical protein
MHPQARYALYHPVFDPPRDMGPGHAWLAAPLVSAQLTVNIGEE